jgi:hypothetical protein
MFLTRAKINRFLLSSLFSETNKLPIVYLHKYTLQYPKSYKFPWEDNIKLTTPSVIVF